jgi:hypothetical protein
LEFSKNCFVRCRLAGGKLTQLIVQLSHLLIVKCSHLRSHGCGKLRARGTR